ncbi:TPA: SGNH/GDSL hydrolase family protein [Clostridium botulinum]|uniref:SGNH/GDSL hydrolase family protein n=1 Tax=Clostridium botulinum TaxID=1491 RepID=UPI00099B7E58|nr:SGNH/GDSL hydrolase family protein [Clostridium botulinum]NFA95929.1 SGNH/GDSL hydrolase family protein [Clostridium botulinum]NFB53035.1 SGNH/GDSL hydrolase family protein [Clostridium botulinum]NFB56525.1 SGNH/GDSL hydrolase family protein [Clostridium botulinum]NFB60812.1 SGNH/GDSL hydrolase family protein [Clostridium botulinum]NFC78424.1 SGNH/GDSL hydrolase family protein [Clostridium botulinum]
MENNKLNIVFLGGSITEGAGASAIHKSYVSILSEYLKEFYSEKNLNFHNASASGTGSNFTLFRLDRDVLVYNPDLIFIEFAVNDRIYPCFDVSVYMESLVRKILVHNSKTKIIFFITPTNMSDACGDIHKKIAYYYNIPTIDIQDYVWREIGKENLTWEKISMDSLHPNDYGHKVYGEYIINFIKKNPSIMNNYPILKKKNLMGICYKNPKFLNYDYGKFYGHWREEEVPLKNRVNLVAASNYIGDAIEIDFKGKYLSLATIFSKDSGILELNIDNKYAFTVDLYNNSQCSFNTVLISKDLEEGYHRLILRVNENKNPSSSGNKVVFGGLLVDEG